MDIRHWCNSISNLQFSHSYGIDAEDTRCCGEDRVRHVLRGAARLSVEMTEAQIICILGGLTYWSCGFSLKWAEIGELGRLSFLAGMIGDNVWEIT